MIFNRVKGLKRFYEPHENDYARAFAEVKRGRKVSHWMWYIFPQIKGLGKSRTADYYAIADIDEARAFLADPYLGKNLREITCELLSKDTNDAASIFGIVDAMKLRSCLTLFYLAAEQDKALFFEALKKYFGAELDEKTLDIIHNA